MDRFLGISSSSSFSSSSSSSSSSAVEANNGGDELNEDDIFWTNDVTELQEEQNSTITSSTSNRRQIFAHNSGILAALSETKRYEVLYRKPIIPLTTRMGTSIPRPPLQEREWLSGTRKLQQQSAPVNVPLLSMAVARERNKKFLEVDNDDDRDEEMLPPHEMVARGSGMSPKTTFSVLEGAGRTLKGRDLRQVRNAVWRKTGFLD
ncbi:hypothetical protein SLE2022_124640 [Rubroshorea leprosula]